MNRSRAILILFMVLAASAAVFSGAYWLADRVSQHQMATSTDDLDWLRLEFGLNETELTRIRQLHEGYLPKCQKWCRLIADHKQALEKEIAKSSSTSPAARELLKKIAILRSNCQTDMLMHFEEVSRIMPADQGRRYLAEMRRLTLGTHEQIEESMAGPKADGHY